MGGSTYFYHYGPQGETRKLTNGSGTVTDTYVYTSYGNAVSVSGSTSNNFRYGGKYGYYSEPDMNIMLATFRWYSPELVRWLSRDPIGYEGGVNLYGYVRENPTKYIDPVGFEPIPKDIQELLQPYYNVDLTKVDIRDDGWNDGLPGYTDLAPIDAGAFTYGYIIYLRKKTVLTKITGLKTLIHELTHVEQFQHNCGFTAKYIAEWIHQYFAYENIKYEREAYEKEFFLFRLLRRRGYISYTHDDSQNQQSLINPKYNILFP